MTITIVVPPRGRPYIRGHTTNDAPQQPRAAGVLFHTRDTQGHARVLLVKRGQGCADYPEHWAFPGGGIEPGETPLQAALRECVEELGINDHQHLVDHMVDMGVSDGFQTYKLRVLGEFSCRLNDEHTEAAWVKPEHLPHPMHPNATAILQRFKD